MAQLLRKKFHPRRTCQVMFCICFLLTSSCAKVSTLIKTPSKDIELGECVALLHGMGRTYRSMILLQDYLTSIGYHTVNLDYPSTEKNIETLAKEHFPQAVEQCEQFQPNSIHFITHSLGGIILRKAFSETPPKNLGRTVMISPPNQGSAVVDELKDWWFYEWLNGPAGQQLSTAPDSVPNQLGPVTYPVGIITGNKHAFFDSWLAEIIPGEDDGKVSISRSKVSGMTDFIIVNESHPFIMKAEIVLTQTEHFLKNGFFKHHFDEEEHYFNLGILEFINNSIDEQ